MTGNATPLQSSFSEARSQQNTEDKTNKFSSRKIWLPKLLYSALPYFYIISGVLAFFATLYISEWFWVLPHYLIFSAVCLHFGIVVYRRRRKPLSLGEE